MRAVRRAIDDSGLQVYDILTCYLQPEIDLEAMRQAHEFGAELGAKYALVIGDDDDWGRMADNFGRLCDSAGRLGLICALEAPVNRRKLTTLDLNLKLITDAGRDNAAICVDPVQYHRAGHSCDLLKEVDPKLIPYAQICDAVSETAMQPYCMPGEGNVPLAEMLDIMPPTLPLSLEYHHRVDSYTPEQWAKHVLEGTRQFLQRYFAVRNS
jgi:sugar phosphate isomerase/epimerase